MKQSDLYSEIWRTYRWERRSISLSTEIIFLVEESPEGGYEARALGFSIYTESETLDELREAIRDAVQCHFGEVEKAGK